MNSKQLNIMTNYSMAILSQRNPIMEFNLAFHKEIS